LNKTKFLGLAALCVMLLSFALSGTVAQDEWPVSVAGEYKAGIQFIDFTDASRDDRALRAVIWYPAQVSADAPRPYPVDDSGAPYPLIIYSHGYGSTPTELSPVIERLVSHGFVVAGVEHRDLDDPKYVTVNRPLDTLFLLNQLADLDADNPLAGMIDTDHVGVTGFSMGGYTTMAAGGARFNPEYFQAWCAEHPDVKPDYYCDVIPMWDEIAAYHDALVPVSEDGLWSPLTDERIKAIFPLAPCRGHYFGEEGLADMTIPTFIVGATDDESCPYDLDAAYFYEHLGSPDRSLVTLDKRTHIAVIRELPLLMTYETAFFGLHLQGKTDYAQYLTPDTASAFRNVTLDVHTEES
jgi:predicted dienelactone hydrolase